MSDNLLTSDETANITRLSRRTLERLRADGTGPQYVKLGRRILYRRSDLDLWIAGNVRCSTSAAIRERVAEGVQI